MKKNSKIIISLLVLILLSTVLWILLKEEKKSDEKFISYIVNFKKDSLKLYWKNDSNENLGSIKNLKNWLNRKNQTLVFAMNAGMFKKDQSPQGLFIEEGNLIMPLDTTNGNGNFYLKPNGVFYITEDNIATICTAPDFIHGSEIKYATQSAPMLVINGEIHPAFNEASTNLNIRNGVGILPGGNIVFAMSKEKINFYDFAIYFKKLNCKNALYLDGFVSRAYLPEENWIQEDGDFGVIIGVTRGKSN